jgi:hypothetical protein
MMVGAETAGQRTVVLADSVAQEVPVKIFKRSIQASVVKVICHDSGDWADELLRSVLAAHQPDGARA